MYYSFITIFVAVLKVEAIRKGYIWQIKTVNMNLKKQWLH